MWVPERAINNGRKEGGVDLYSFLGSVHQGLVRSFAANMSHLLKPSDQAIAAKRDSQKGNRK